MKIKASDVWLWQFSKRHGNAYGCTFGEGIVVPTVELSLFAKSCLGWSQGASLFLGLRVFFAFCYNSLNTAHIRGLSKKYPTLNFPAHSSDARAVPLCTAEGDSLMRMLEFFLRVRVCKSLPAGRRVRCCYTCSSDL